MIEMAHLLRDKATWKICEAVRLGLDSIYLSFQNLCEAGDEFLKGRDQGIYKSFEKASTVAYKFILTDRVLEDYRKDIIPNLPCYWWVDKQPWMRED